MMIKDKVKKYTTYCLASIVVTCLFVGGCTSNSEVSKDVLTQKKTEKGRTKITVLTKYAFSINDFEKSVEDKFDDIDIVQVGDYTANTALGQEYAARLEHDDLTDIVMTWPYGIGEEYWKDRLIDLSGLSFTNKYNMSMLDSMADENNSLYYLPGPASIRGIVYNKTMFEENGWSVPKNYQEFIALCKQIEASGHRAFQLPLGNGEVLDTAFTGFNYGTSYSKPEDSEWLANYNKGKGNFLEHFNTSLDTFQDLINNGIIKASDLDLYYSDTQNNLYNRGTVMTEDSVQLIKMANTVGNSKDEYAIMPFFNRDPESSWARLYMVCYIGLNKHLQEDVNEDKYEKVLKVMDYISSQEGQEALSSGNGSMYSSLKNMEAPKDKEINDMRDTLSRGRYGTFPTLERSEEALRQGLIGMLKGTLKKDDVANMVDEENQHTVQVSKPTIIAKASADFTMVDTGNYITDVMRKATKSDIALFLDNGKDGKYNGLGLSAKIYKGDITEIDLQRIMPDFKLGDKGEISKVSMNGKNLKNTLEYSIPISNTEGWFYYFSGLKVKIDPTEKMGSRIKAIETADGKKIEDSKKYTIAILDGSVKDEYIISNEKTDLLITNLIKKDLSDRKSVSPVEDERFIIVNE